MGKLFRGIGRVLGVLAKITAITLPILFVIYMWNLDMKLMGLVYEVLNKFHDRKPRDIQF